MANKKATKKSSSSAKNDPNVVRIKASSSAPSSKNGKVVEAEVTKVVATTSDKKTKTTKVVKAEKVAKEPKKRRATRGLSAFGGYFKGAWVELRQVRWPNRRATWSLTAAVLIYTAFFVALILLLDAGFQLLFDQILGN